MCKYCDAGAMLRSSGVELPGGQKAAMTLFIEWRKDGTPIIRAKINYSAEDKKVKGYMLPAVFLLAAWESNIVLSAENS